MKTYILLLRGINVSGKNKLPMESLREMFHNLGYQNVKTYIQSGNIIVTSAESKKTICQKIENEINIAFGYNVPVIAKTISEWKQAIENYPFPTENPKIAAFVFLNQTTSETEIETNNINDDAYKIDNDIVYIYCPSTFAKTKLSNNFFERKLHVKATTRNYNTTLTLLKLAST